MSETHKKYFKITVDNGGWVCIGIVLVLIVISLACSGLAVKALDTILSLGG
jgi:hypothetical protein